MRRNRTIKRNLGNNTNNRSNRKRARTAGFRFSWIIVGASIVVGSSLFLFVFPILHEGGDSFTGVNGFVTNKPQKRVMSTNKESNTAMAAQKQEEKVQGKFHEAIPTDEESPTLRQSQNEHQHQQHPKMTYYKSPNPSDFATYGYKSNPTVFGSILRGELPTKFLLEREEVIAFEDIRPRAPFHALVISKGLIPSVLELNDSDSENQKSLSLLQKMSEAAHDLVRNHQPEAFERGDYRLCFHIPPFNSVDHLHLHVLAPASSMAYIYRHGKYNTGMSSDGKHRYNVRWCIDLSEVEANLRNGSPPTPYQRDDSWTTVLSDLFSSIQSIIGSNSE